MKSSRNVRRAKTTSHINIQTAFCNISLQKAGLVRLAVLIAGWCTAFLRRHQGRKFKVVLPVGRFQLENICLMLC